MALDSSVTILRLNWSTGGSTDRNDNARQASPKWMDANKLAELGFDCSVPLSSPKARKHYSSMPARRAFLALENLAGSSQNEAMQARPTTGLIVADAAWDAARLRQSYSDPGKHLICRGLVRVVLRDRNPQDGSLLQTPYLQGWIQGLSPSEVSVPLPKNRLLTQQPRPAFEDENKPLKLPRFSARVRWGKNHEPWVEEVRPLETRHETP
jgi:hypothetical protein